MPQVRFSSPSSDKAKTAESSAESPVDFLRANSSNGTRAILRYADRLLDNGFIDLGSTTDWSETVRTGGKYFIVRNHFAIVAFVVGGQCSTTAPVAVLGMQSKVYTLLLQSRKLIAEKGYEKLAGTTIVPRGGKSWWSRCSGTLAGKITYLSKDGIKLETVVSLADQPFARMSVSDHPQLDVICKELDVPVARIKGIQLDMFDVQHLSTKDIKTVPRCSDSAFSFLALDSLINASTATSTARSKRINTVICFDSNDELRGSDPHFPTSMQLVTSLLERVMTALDPQQTSRKALAKTSPNQVLKTILTIVHFIYLICIMIRSTFSRTYHLLSNYILTSNSRELIKSDISVLGKIPSHLATIISGPALDVLVDDVANLAAWSICSSIPVLTIYESRGEVKGIDSSIQVAIKRKLRRYFRDTKKIVIRTPGWGTTTSNIGDDDSSIPDLEINLLSRDDGREAILELTRSLCKLASQPTTHSPPSYKDPSRSPNGIIKNWTANGHSSHSSSANPFFVPNGISRVLNGKSNGHHDFDCSPQSSQGGVNASPLRNSTTFHSESTPPTSPALSEYRQNSTVSVASDLLSSDITIPLLDAHLCNTTITEPNLLLVFTKARKLDGFPPWSLRLCEICWVGTNGRVTYRGFLRGLKRFGKAEMRWGR